MPSPLDVDHVLDVWYVRRWRTNSHSQLRVAVAHLLPLTLKTPTHRYVWRWRTYCQGWLAGTVLCSSLQPQYAFVIDVEPNRRVLKRGVSVLYSFVVANATYVPLPGPHHQLLVS